MGFNLYIRVRTALAVSGLSCVETVFIIDKIKVYKSSSLPE